MEGIDIILLIISVSLAWLFGYLTGNYNKSSKKL